MNNEELLKIAHTRELTDERVIVAAAYWLDCSPHERTEADGVILARYARKAIEEIYQLKAHIAELEQVEKDYNELVQLIKRTEKSMTELESRG